MKHTGSTPVASARFRDALRAALAILMALVLAVPFTFGASLQAQAAEPSTGGKTLVAYFTWSNTTERLAQHIAEQTSGDLLEIEPSIPYPTDYTETGNLAKTERDTNARPAIANLPANLDEYDTIIIGYPIWWHTAPMIIGTFLEAYDLTGKDVYPFTQSASMDTTQFQNSYEFVKSSAGNATVHELLATKSTSEIDAYLSANGLLASSDSDSDAASSTDTPATDENAGTSDTTDSAGSITTQATGATFITLSYRSATMSVGDRVDLNVVSITPSSASKAVTWKTSSKKRATVNSKGVVRAKKTGTVTITATSKTGTAKRSVKIKIVKNTKVASSKVLVVYYSATGTTKGIAKKIAKATDGDLQRLTPASRYTDADIDYSTDNCRAEVEQMDSSSRPALKGKVARVAKYKTVYIGYPIWWNLAPRICPIGNALALANLGLVW